MKYQQKTSLSLSLLSAFSLLFLSPQIEMIYAQDAAWETVDVPSTWKRPRTLKPETNGFTWYRAVVSVPEEWRGEKTKFLSEPIDDAREYYINGIKIGSAGNLPPKFRSGLGEDHEHDVPANALLYGESNVIAIRVAQRFPRGGFNVAPPVLITGKQAIQMGGAWQFRAGDNLQWRLWDDSDRKPFSFNEIEDAEQVLQKRQSLTGEKGPFTPQEAIKLFTTPDDLEVTTALSDPHIAQPLSMKFDERGRLWVMEYRQYPDIEGLKMVSRDIYLRSVYDKIPLPPPHGDKGRDRISIHEDTNGDGTFDSHKVFVDGLNLATSFEFGRGGVFVTNPPYLLFYADTNGDDLPDNEPTVLLEGFGLEDSHSVANSMRFGPDGWLYGAQGSTVSGKVRRYGSADEPVVSMGQLIWRYHPERNKYEIFAEGGGNTFGVEIDQFGRVFSGHNGGNTRGFHYVQGGYSQKGFGKHGQLSNPYTFGYFPYMKHHDVVRFTHTYVIYQDSALPEQYHGNLFGVEPLQGRVVRSEISADGSTFATKDLGHPLTTTDTWFRPVDIKVGPDGAIYVADMYEQRIDHASHYQGRIDRKRGRVYRIAAKGQPEQRKTIDYGALSTSDLIASVAHESPWHRSTALRVLADRRDRSAITRLTEIVGQAEGTVALNALWALNASGGFTPEFAENLLRNHPDSHVVSWTIRLATDELLTNPNVDPKPILTAFINLAQTNQSVHVRSQLACSARRISDASSAMLVVKELVTHGEDTNDPHVPLLIWWAIESFMEDDSETVVSTLLADESTWFLELVQTHLVDRMMKRLILSGKQKHLNTAAAMFDGAPDKSTSGKLMTAFEASLQGQSLAGLPEQLVAALKKAGGGSIKLQVRQGIAEAIESAIKQIADANVDAKLRIDLITVLGEVKSEQALPALKGLLANEPDNTVLQNTISAIQSFEDSEIGTIAVQRLSAVSEDTRQSLQSLLASRPQWSIALAAAVKDERLAQDTVRLSTVRRMLLHDDADLTAVIGEVWKSVDGASTEEMRELTQKYTQILSENTGNPYDGRTLFAKHCGKCHQLFNTGGNVGPNLTAFKRDDIQRMLENIVNPSLEIREGYENFAVFTSDGRTLTGFIDDQDNRVVVMRGVDGQRTVVNRDDIEELTGISRSVMPEGILKTLSDDEIRNLFAYLRASQPLP